MPNQLSRDEVIVGDLKVLTGGQVEKVLVCNITRAMTTATLLGSIPAGATILSVSVCYPVVSNAGTTATASLGTTTAANEIVNAFDVKGNAAQSYGITAAQGLVVTKLGAVGSTALSIYGIYAETGTASSAGGPFTMRINFVTATS